MGGGVEGFLLALIFIELFWFTKIKFMGIKLFYDN